MHISADPKVLHFQQGAVMNNGWSPAFILSDGALQAEEVLAQ